MLREALCLMLNLPYYQLLLEYQYNLMIVNQDCKDFSKERSSQLKPILYGQYIFIKNLSHNRLIQDLWGRGFMDKKIYLSKKQGSCEAQFTIQPKKGLYSCEGKTKTPVAFGAEVLIKHVISQNYIAIKEHDDMPVLQFQEQQSSSCYFQFVPCRSFESNGDIITTDSVFVILNSQRKLYITDLENIESLPQPSSPSHLNKKISKQQSLLGSNMMSEPRSFSGSVNMIPIDGRDNYEKEDCDSIGINFKRKGKKTLETIQQHKKFGSNSEIDHQEQAIKTKKQSSLFGQRLVLAKTSSVDQQVKLTEHQKDKTNLNEWIEVKRQSADSSKINDVARLLPIYNKQKTITVCSVENYSYSQWTIEHVNTQLKTQYLTNRDFIYFSHSQANQIMLLDIQKVPFEVSFVKNTNQSETQYILSSIFQVQVEIQEKNKEKLVYLKHFLTGKYFPPRKNGQKTLCELLPLLSPKKNQHPPFKILFAGEVFEKTANLGQKESLHGFWLNKIPKTEISEVMSIQNISKGQEIRQLSKYLRTNTRRGQKMLREFLYIPRLVSQLVTLHKKGEGSANPNIKQYYQLLFYICRNNDKNKKQCLKYIEQILKHPEKQLILDLLTELLIQNSNNYSVQRAITPSVIQDQVKEFVKGESYSISFMRIFRVFCGSDEQPSMRNQCLLFNLFFWGNPVNEGLGMTESVVHSQRKIELPQKYKFRVFQDNGSIYFSNGMQQQKYQNLSEEILNYIRQYYYLLSDCMNGNNYPLIRNFTSATSFDLLLKLLQKEEMKGPILSIIYNAYLKPQKKYRPHIFHKDYEKICEKGSLLSYCNQQQQRLRNFVDKQIRANTLYTSTMYRILLNVFKLTIDNAYWRQFQYLIDLMRCLDGVILYPQSKSQYHNTYQEKASDRNLLKSKITAISIKIVLIQMQVSLWTSDYVSGVYTENEIQRKLVDQIKHTKNWVIDEKILRLCSTNSPQLLRKSILLLYKIYNLYKLSHKTYEEAQIETHSKKDLVNIFSTLQLKQQMKTDNYFLIITGCFRDIFQIQQIIPKNLQSYYRNLESLFKYKQVNQQVQNMAYKLGLHDALIADIRRYATLVKKLKQQEEDIIYWKLLTLYAIIRNNLKLRDIIAQHRKIFLPFLESEGSHYYIAVDIIQQIYRNNRKLIISDNQELKSVCKSIDVVYKNGKMDLRFCKVINLLSIFIQTGNRKIVENHQIILQYVFTKNFVSSIIKVMKSQSGSKKQSAVSEKKEEYFRNVIQIVIYDLLVTMGQKKLLSYFERPSNETIYALLLGIGINNWNLKSKAFLCINFAGIKDDITVQILRIILYDLNVMCESLKMSDEQELSISKQVKIYISNIGKILDTIHQLFKASQKKLAKQSEEQVLVLKIVQRLFIMKGFCPEIVHKNIEDLLPYIGIIEKRLKVKSQYFDLTNSLKKIEIGDFERNQIKDKLPLIYGEKLKSKTKINKMNLLQQKNMFVEEVVRKKEKINDMNKNNFQMTEEMIKELRTLILSLSFVNKTDSSFLSDNIKQFLVNFLRISFLEGNEQQLVAMQDILVTYEVPTIVCSILEEPFKHRYKLFTSTFQLGIGLLEGGHSKCQDKFLQKFKQDAKNWIFQNIYQIIFDSLATIEFYYNYKQDPTIKSYEMILELEQYYTCRQQRRLSCELLAKSFRFLQLLCENDNHQMKQYVYNQLDKEGHIKYMTKNFIELAQRIMDGVFIVIEFNIRELNKRPNGRYEEEVRSNIYNLPIYILDFLIEVCQIPAEQNQLYLCRTDFLDFVKKLIDLRKYTMKNKQQGKDWSIFFIYEKKLIILLKSLLENNSQEISTLIKKKIGNDEFQFFIQESFAHGGLEDTDKLSQMLNQTKLNVYIENIVDILIVKKIVKIQEQFQFESEKQKIVNELSNRIQSIHVDFQTHSLTVYFPFHPLFNLLSKKTKDFMLDRSANLTTRREKLTQLLISRSVIYQDINQQINSEQKLLNQQKMGYLFNFALFLCFLIVFFLVLFYSVGRTGAVLDIFESQIISGLCYMQLLVSVMYAIFLGFNTYPIANEKIKAHQSLKRRSDPNFKYNKIQLFLKRLQTIYIDQLDTTPALILLIISIYACFFEVRVYSFTLIFVFAKIELLQSILKSFRLTWKQLAFVCLLALVFSFIFGFITLNYYIGPLYENEDIDIDIDRINQHCNSIITCVSSLYTQKIIGESVSREDEEYNYGRFVSDIVYWGFFQILLSNIIAAIIIDKFAQQRNSKQRIQYERYSKCYICFAEKNTLQRRGQDFMSHVSNVHNIWNYFFYMYTLENLKDITDFTGIQYWINRQVKQNQIDWIPIDDSFKDEDVSLSDLLQKMKLLIAERELDDK